MHFKFAHLADCHIGCWRDPKLREATIEAFKTAVERCISVNVDFILISGDLFNTSLPSIDELSAVVKELKKLEARNIPVYSIPGSHDYSPSGKTMLAVLESAKLITLVSKADADHSSNKIRLLFTTDKKTGAKITGMLGKKGGLESEYYKILDKEALASEPGFKIFMFHSAITEFKPKSLAEMPSIPLSLLPEGFNYYAGGHVHERFQHNNIVFPGPLFPANFKEFESLHYGSFCIVSVDNNKITEIKFEPIQLFPHVGIMLNVDGKTPSQAKEALLEELKQKNLLNAIVTIRVEGKLSHGKPSDMQFNEIFDHAYEKGAFFVMKNTSKLHGELFKEVKITATSTEEIEEKLINEHLQQIKMGLSKEQEKNLVKELISALDIEKEEGETTTTFEERLKQNFERILEKHIKEIKP